MKDKEANMVSDILKIIQDLKVVTKCCFYSEMVYI